MSADIYTKGFNDKGLFCRLLLLANLYSPDQWSRNVLRPVPMLADKSAAIGSENFMVLCSTRNGLFSQKPGPLVKRIIANQLRKILSLKRWRGF